MSSRSSIRIKTQKRSYPTSVTEKRRYDGRDRRQQERVLLDAPLRLLVPDLDKLCRAQGVDISRGGMYIMTDDVFAMGTEIDLELTDAKGRLQMHVRCKVVRHDPRGGFGVEFVSVYYESSTITDLLRDTRKKSRQAA